MLAGIVCCYHLAGTGIGIGKRAGTFQIRNQAGNRRAEIRHRLIEINVRSSERDFGANLLGNLDTVIQITVGIQRLQQNQHIVDPRVRCVGCPLNNTQRCHHFCTDSCPQHQITNGEGNRFARAIAEGSGVTGCTSVAACTVVKTCHVAVHKGAGATFIVTPAAATKTAGQRQGNCHQGYAQIAETLGRCCNTGVHAALRFIVVRSQAREMTCWSPSAPAEHRQTCKAQQRKNE